jgi:copper resistance protein D
MLPDLLSAVLRGLSFVTILQAGGAAIFLVLFRPADLATRQIRRLTVIAVVASVPLLCAQYLLEAARMTGTLSGAFDSELQEFVLQSTASRVLGLRLLGVILVGVSLRSTGWTSQMIAFLGALSIAVSFALIGHVASSPAHLLLSMALLVHVLILEFWFGSLLPLRVVCGQEEGIQAAHLLHRFSAIATILVPVVFVAGLVMTIGLLPSVAAIRDPYGLALVAKVGAFAVLMLLAALNKWRYGPALAAGDPAAQSRFNLSVLTEYAIIATVLMSTATLTTFWSPEASSV